jgi:uncharacterized DUF497 family protein
MLGMKRHDWSDVKNNKLKKDRGVSFEDVVFHIDEGFLIDIIESPSKKHKGQFSYVVKMHGYIYLVPFIEAEDRIILKTIIPSRKFMKVYMGGK